MIKDVKEAIQQFGEKVGIADLALDDQQLCELTVGDGLDVFFQGTESETELRLNGRVGFLPGDDTATLMGLLTANYNGEGTGAAALGVDTETDEVILGQAIDVAGLDADAFLETVETFVKYLTYWTEQLPTLGSPVSADRPAESELAIMTRV